jgi:CDP-diacylglycerol--serine O-phosphatidyltransferase
LTVKRVYIIPNLFTAGNLFCGLLAIFEAVAGFFDSSRGYYDQAHIVLACQLVLLAGIFDVFDGVAARITKAQSSFGLHFDSLADVISFGAAPAMLAFAMFEPAYPRLARATCGLYVICAALRLARFNVQAMREEKKSFLGLPSPGAGCAVVALVWTFATRTTPWGELPSEKLLPIVMVLAAYLMVSKVPYIGLKSIRLSNRQPFEILVSIVVILSIVFMLKAHLDLLLLSIFGFYALSGPALLVVMRKKLVGAESKSTEPTGDTAQRGPSAS